MQEDFATSRSIELIARGVVIHNGKILLCKGKTFDNYYFPGGHVEFNEDSREALEREIKEETGAVITDTRFIGALENQFGQNGMEKHELNIVFEARITSPEIKNLEDHIQKGANGMD